MPKIMLVNFTPKQCPNCGAAWEPWHNIHLKDWRAHCSHTCKCGLKFQLVDENDLLELAGKTGDMPQYIG